MRPIRSALYAAAIALTAAPVTAQNLTVATWNLEHFAGQEETGCRGRVQSDYDEIRRIINNIDADAWLLQEVESAGALARVFDPSKYTLIAETRPELANPGTCRENGRPFGMQRTAMAIRTSLLLGRAQELPFLDVSNNGTLRHGQRVTVNLNGMVVTILNVHLKSGCFSGITGEGCDQLFEQIPYLTSYAAELSDAGHNLIIGGDFNRRLGNMNDEVMATLRYNRRMGLEISSEAGTSRCSLRGERAIDYILTNLHFRETFRTVDVVEHTFTGPFESWPSDHCPMVVEYDFR